MLREPPALRGRGRRRERRRCPAGGGEGGGGGGPLEPLALGTPLLQRPARSRRRRPGKGRTVSGEGPLASAPARLRGSARRCPREPPPPAQLRACGPRTRRREWGVAAAPAAVGARGSPDHAVLVVGDGTKPLPPPATGQRRDGPLPSTTANEKKQIRSCVASSGDVSSAFPAPCQHAALHRGLAQTIGRSPIGPSPPCKIEPLAPRVIGRLGQLTPGLNLCIQHLLRGREGIWVPKPVQHLTFLWKESKRVCAWAAAVTLENF